MTRHAIEDNLNALEAYTPLPKEIKDMAISHFPRDSNFSFDDVEACAELALDTMGLENSAHARIMMGARIFNALLLHNKIIEDSERASWQAMALENGSVESHL